MTTATVAITPEILRDHGLTLDEYERIKALLGGREPSFTELGIFSVMWSEHCSYKSSRVHLKRLPTHSRRVLQGPGENAGIIDIGGGWACAFKIESHNHPSFIEPFQGATTGVGGILRDIFTMGARPVAVMDSLRFGPITTRHGGTGVPARPTARTPAAPFILRPLKTENWLFAAPLAAPGYETGHTQNKFPSQSPTTQTTAARWVFLEIRLTPCQTPAARICIFSRPRRFLRSSDRRWLLPRRLQLRIFFG